VYFGGNWTDSNLRDQLEGLDWEESVAQVDELNTIATLVFHMTYFVRVMLGALNNGILDGKDIYSFEHPPIRSQKDWEKMLQQTWQDAASLAAAIEKFPEEKLGECFFEEKYGSYYRNFQGIIEHCHYHLGQVVLIRKILSSKELG
jgi:hypothetical protein